MSAFQVTVQLALPLDCDHSNIIVIARSRMLGLVALLQLRSFVDSIEIHIDDSTRLALVPTIKERIRWKQERRGKEISFGQGQL